MQGWIGEQMHSYWMDACYMNKKPHNDVPGKKQNKQEMIVGLNHSISHVLDLETSAPDAFKIITVHLKTRSWTIFNT